MPKAYALLALFLLFSGGAHAVENEFDLGEYGRSAIPIVGYDDKTGWLLGAAGFLYSDKEPSVNAGLFFVSNLNDFHSATLNYERRGAGPWTFTLHLLGERVFDRYYGEGDLTPSEDRLFIRMSHFEVRPALLYKVLPHLRLGAFVELRTRAEEDTQAFPDESSQMGGLLLQWDSRDKLINTRQGDFLQLQAARMPWDGAFSRFDLDYRHFVRLDGDGTWGTHLVAGTEQGGTPSYLFRYYLGGLDLLRGYKQNRFRGNEFFVLQEELRWILYKWLSVNASVDVGAIRDGAYHQLKASVQIGLRLGLPPDWGQKMRVDLGFGADQMTFQIQFGEIF